jgi:hypothetical protein
MKRVRQDFLSGNQEMKVSKFNSFLILFADIVSVTVSHRIIATTSGRGQRVVRSRLRVTVATWICRRPDSPQDSPFRIPPVKSR